MSEFDVDQWAAHELELYTTNTGKLYPELRAVYRYAAKCRGKGAQARMEAWLKERAVPAYQKEIDCDFRPGPCAIEQAAESILDSFFAEYDLGNYEEMRP